MNRRYLIKPLAVCIVVCAIALGILLHGCKEGSETVHLEKGVYTCEAVIEVRDDCEYTPAYTILTDPPIVCLDYNSIYSHRQLYLLAKDEGGHVLLNCLKQPQPENHLIE